MPNRTLISLTLLAIGTTLQAQDLVVASPDNQLQVTIVNQAGKPTYAVSYKGQSFLEPSPLGVTTNVGDYSQQMTYVSKKENRVEESYSLASIKKSQVNYIANELITTWQNPAKQNIEVIFRVSNNDIGFRYRVLRSGKPAALVIEKELSGFDFPTHTTTFLTPQASPMIGWERTKPSYEEEYTADGALGARSKYGVGFTFPALFRIGSNGWVLLSETGVNGSYCGAKLSEGNAAGLYSIAFPEPGENNGLGSVTPGMAFPAETPWRTITLGTDLKPIVETTIAFDLVKPLMEPSIPYTYGRSVWSWILWQDGSINYNDQLKYIDLAATMGYEFSLVDNWWDTRIGREKVEELAAYAKSKNVSLMMWYNSNGYWNDAPQGPKQRMNTAMAREKEMAWLKKIGVKGIKVDFFAGDKQTTMQLYEDILADANRYGLLVIFHGATMPRGWERMYPNYAGSEAVLASENLIFTQHANDNEAFNAALHPFIRNSTGAMEFGPVLLNKRHNKENNGGTIRKTTDVFQLATSILFQNPVQVFSLAPNNLQDAPPVAIEFMKQVPTTWDETRFIEGYPGKYVVLARRHKDKWYLAAINAQKEPLKVKLNLSFLGNAPLVKYADDKNRNPVMEKVTADKKGNIDVEIATGGGVIITNGIQ
ncbi:glycoside hydrolase family 97 protein [Paraflavitalea pollutisoli]|uniref:glycoside hydrolase family 97 protein n=1 Tax=Paraflavitalea pollutisoli TaxID=3034143 RepID=UPI0023EA7D66|nr:glycoside hydrolase family 97 protein [Paraflavitalea sp. H1-2-19X]